MRTKVTSNAPQVGKAMKRLFADQGPFARAVALNETAKKAQKFQRRHMESIFTVRRMTFVSRSVKWKPRATKRRQWTALRLEPPAAARQGALLSHFEAEDRVVGGVKGKRKPVPVDVRTTGTGVAVKRERVGEIAWRRVNDRLFVGPKGERMIILSPTTGVVLFPKKGPEDRVGYLLVPEVPITPNLRFVENIQAEVVRVFPDELAKAWDRAIRTAR